MLRAGDNIPKGGSISWYKLDNVGGKASLPEDTIHGVAGQHSGVAGFPQDDIALPQRQDDDSYDEGHSCPSLSPLCRQAIPTQPPVQLQGCPLRALSAGLYLRRLPRYSYSENLCPLLLPATWGRGS